MKALGIAATGMLAQQTNVDVIANNIANYITEYNTINFSNSFANNFSFEHIAGDKLLDVVNDD